MVAVTSFQPHNVFSPDKRISQEGIPTTEQVPVYAFSLIQLFVKASLLICRLQNRSGITRFVSAIFVCQQGNTREKNSHIQSFIKHSCNWTSFHSKKGPVCTFPLIQYWGTCL